MLFTRSIGLILIIPIQFATDFINGKLKILTMGQGVSGRVLVGMIYSHQPHLLHRYTRAHTHVNALNARLLTISSPCFFCLIWQLGCALIIVGFFIINLPIENYLKKIKDDSKRFIVKYSVLGSLTFLLVVAAVIYAVGVGVGLWS